MNHFGRTALVVGLVFAVGLLAGSHLQAAEQNKATVQLTNLLRSELEVVDGAEIIVSLVDIPPQTSLPRHYHPGEEFAYILEGKGTLWLKDAPNVEASAGELLKIPLKRVHTAMTGDVGMKALVFRIHKTGEPERILSE